MKKIYFVLSFLFFSAFSFIAKAQSGTLDLTFAPGTGANNPIYTTAIQSDGKIIIAGDFTRYNGTVSNHIARLNADGTIDGTFSSGIGLSNGTIWNAVIQSDGKIIISGTFTAYNGAARIYIARLNADGTLDAAFNPGTGPNSAILATAIQSDGKIIIGGDFTTYNGTTRYRIARLNTDGTLDETFNSTFGVRNGAVNTAAVQSDGKIIIGGGFATYNLYARQCIARINADGSLDSTFDPVNGLSGGYVYSTATQSDGKIIIGGWFNAFNGAVRNCIVRLNASGTLDTDFNPGTGFSGGDVRTIVIQNDGKIIIGGYFDSYNGTAQSKIARLNSNGTLDATFNQVTGVNSYYVYASALQSDGKILIAGNFTEFNGIARKNIARIIGYTTPTAVSSVQTKTATIYPNPVKNEFVIKIDGNNEKTNLEIVNSIGQVVFKANFMQMTTVDTRHFAPGAYVVKIENSKGVEIKKIIKE